MQNLLTDINPEFAVGEQHFITNFDIDQNCYHLGKGPDCGRKWFAAHKAQPFISIDDVTEEQLHPNVFDAESAHRDDFFVEGTLFDRSAVAVGEERFYDDRYTRQALACEARLTADGDVLSTLFSSERLEITEEAHFAALCSTPMLHQWLSIEIAIGLDDTFDDLTPPLYEGSSKARCISMQYAPRH